MLVPDIPTRLQPRFCLIIQTLTSPTCFRRALVISLERSLRSVLHAKHVLPMGSSGCDHAGICSFRLSRLTTEYPGSLLPELIFDEVHMCHYNLCLAPLLPILFFLSPAHLNRPASAGFFARGRGT